MYINDLVRSATDRLAPKTDHPRAVVGGIVVATSLVVLSFTWAILPWGALTNLIVTIIAATTLIVATEIIHHAAVRRRSRKATLAATKVQHDVPAPEQQDAGSGRDEAPQATAQDVTGTPTQAIPAVAERLVYSPEKWPSYSDWLMSLDPEERADIYITEQLIASHADEAYADALAKEDKTIHWKERPHIKYFIKRIWWRVLIILPLGIAAIVGSIMAIRHFSLSGWLYLVPVLILLWLIWYGWRRWYKWHELYLVIQGSWFIIQKAKNSWLGLYGDKANSPRVPLISCNNIVPSESFFEGIRIPPWGEDGRPLFDSGRIDINTSIRDREDGDGNYDDFRHLKDVRRHTELAELIEYMHDRLIAGRPTIMRTLQSNP